MPTHPAAYAPGKGCAALPGLLKADTYDTTEPKTPWAGGQEQGQELSTTSCQSAFSCSNSSQGCRKADFPSCCPFTETHSAA